MGPLVATAVVSAIGNGAPFHKGREFAAWLGLVPRQWSTGGKPKLLGISKRGNPYLRKMFIHGARAAVLRVKREGSCLGQWMSGLETRAARNVVIVATANKLARISRAVLVERNDYRPMPPPLSFQLDEVDFEIRFAEVCRRTGRTKTQSNGVPENLCRNTVFHDRGDY